ncbi:MAG TPA: flagellar protein FlaG [Saliniramus sp.]|nr:flagellar protein FlaG [Saliniramus sp.]
MDVGGVNRPAVTSSQAVSQRVDPPVASGFARTELSREASVQPVEEASAVRFEPSEGSRERAALDAAMQRVVERSMEVDDRTRNVVFRAVDEKSGEVMLQLPSEQALKLRAYLRETTASVDGAGEPKPSRERIA